MATKESDQLMNSVQGSGVTIPKWLHWVFIVLAMALVYRLTVWSEGEVRDERYYQRSMGAGDLVRQFAERLFSGMDPAVVTDQYIAERVVTTVGPDRAALQNYFADVVANGAQLLSVVGSGDTAILQYSVNGEVRLDVLRVQVGEIIEHTPYTRAGTAE